MLTLEQLLAEEKKRYREADRGLNEAYKRLYARSDGPAREKLMKAQRSWIAFRDADAALRGYYGCGNMKSADTGKKEELVIYGALRGRTEERIKELVILTILLEAAAKR